MTVAAMFVRSQWRQRLIALGLLTVAVSAGVAVVLTAGAGARRTSSAYDRLVEATRRYDVGVEDDRGDEGVLDEVGSLPGVAAADRIALFFFIAAEHDLQTLLVAPHDGVSFTAIDRPLLVDGRAPDPARADEILINEAFRDATGLGPGDTLEIATLTPAQLDSVLTVGDPGGAPAGPELEVEIAGVGRLPLSIDRPDPQALGTPAFYATFRQSMGSLDTSARIRLTAGEQGVEDFLTAMRTVDGFDAGHVFTEFGTEDDSRVVDGTRLQAVALGAFAALAALAAMAAFAQAVGRHLELNRVDGATLGGLGLPAWQRAAILASPLVPVIVAGTVLGVVAAGVASGLFPTGLAAKAEPDPGMQVDVAFLAAAGVALATVALAIVVLAARRVSVRRSAPARASRVTLALARSGATPSTLMGARMALEPGHGDRRLPVRSTLVGATASIAVLAGAAAFSQSLDHMLETPRQYGWSWDATVTIGSDFDATRDAAELMAGAEGVRAVAIAADTDIEIDGDDIETQALTAVKGTIAPVLLEGSAPQGLDEIALGPALLEDLGRSVGDRVAVETTGEPIELVISGTVLFPGGEDQQGVGAWVTPELLDSLGRDVESSFDLHLDVEQGTDIEELIDPIDGSGDVFISEQPTTVKNLALTRRAPVQIGIFVGILGLIAVGHALVTAARRRRHDIAVLRALGSRRRDGALIVAWHAIVLAVVATFVGVPAGVAIGRLVWIEFATNAHVLPQPTITTGWLVTLVVAPLLATAAVATMPAMRATRFSLGHALRAE